MIKVGINGFGRIGRLVARVILDKYKGKLDLVCINTSGSMETAGWVHLFGHDTVYGKYSGEVKVVKNKMMVGRKGIPVLGERDPAKIPWGRYGTQVVIESTGVFRKEKDARLHLRGSVKKVIISAPPKEGEVPMYVIGVNDKDMGKGEVISAASCTTNCVAPVAKVVGDNFGIKKGLMTTIHAYTGDQELLDGSHKDLRRARAAALNIVPTTTGAARATGKVYSLVEGKFDGMAVRVPVACGSLTDFTFVVGKRVTVGKVNAEFKRAAKGYLKGILGVTEEPLVSSDIIGTELSTIVDLSLTMVMGGDLVKVIAWYDNEWGYTNRLVETVLLAGKK